MEWAKKMSPPRSCKGLGVKGTGLGKWVKMRNHWAIVWLMYKDCKYSPPDSPSKSSGRTVMYG